MFYTVMGRNFQKLYMARAFAERLTENVSFRFPIMEKLDAQTPAYVLEWYNKEMEEVE